MGGANFLKRMLKRGILLWTGLGASYGRSPRVVELFVRNCAEMQEIRQGLQITDRYVVQSLIGRGGMGEVYLAIDEQTRRKVALKLIRPELSMEPKMRRRFYKEARAFSYLKHENIVEIFDFGQTAEQRLYIAMEYVNGESLRDLRKLALPMSVVIDLICQLLDALGHAHARGIVHRDLKSENVLVRMRDGKLLVKLVDFGLAALPQFALGNETGTGAILGTPGYMAPEQVRGNRGTVGPATDVYSIGVILFEILSGELPFTGRTGIETILAHINQEIPPLTLLPHFSKVDGLEEIIHKALAKKPWDRFVNASEFRRALVNLHVKEEELPEIPELSRLAAKSLNTGVDVDSTAPTEDFSVLRHGSRTLDSGAYKQSSTSHEISSERSSEVSANPVSARGSGLQEEFKIRVGMVGRTHEEALLRAYCDAAIKGRGGVYFIRGPFGVGKSRLLRSTLQAVSHLALKTVSAAYTRERPSAREGMRSVFAQILQCENVDDDALFGYLRDTLRPMGLFDEKNALALLRYLRPTPQMELAQDQRVTGLQGADLSVDVDYLLRIIVAFSEKKPLFIAVDDIHWGASDAFYLLEQISQWAARGNAHVLVLACFDDTELSPVNRELYNLCNLKKFNALLEQGIVLQALRNDAMRSLLSIGLSLGPDVTQFIIEKSGGNPAYAIALAQHLRKSGRISRGVQANFHFVQDGAKDVGEPAAIAQYFKSRLDEIALQLGTRSEFYSEVLLRVAVFGSFISTMQLEAFRRLESDDALKQLWPQAIESWLDYKILVRCTQHEMEGLAFSDRAMRGVVYEGASLRKVRRIHLSAAQALRELYHDRLSDDLALQIADHFEAASEKEKSYEFKFFGAQLAENNARFQVASRRYAELFAVMRKRFPTDEEESVDLEAMLYTPIDWTKALVCLTRLEIILGMEEDAEFYLDQLAYCAQRYGLARLTGEMHRLRGLLLSRHGKLPASTISYGTARNIFLSSHDENGEALSLFGCAVQSLKAGMLVEARQWAKEASGIFEESGDYLGAARADALMAYINFFGALLPEALFFSERAAAVFNSANLVYEQKHVKLLQTFVQLHHGGYSRISQAFGQIAKDFVNIGDENTALIASLSKLLTDILSNEMHSARSQIGNLEQRVGLLSDCFLGGYLKLFTAVLAYYENKLVEAIEGCKLALELLDESGDRRGLAWTHALLSRIALRHEHIEQAEQYFNTAHEYFTLSSDALGIAIAADIWAQICMSKQNYPDALLACKDQCSIAEKLGSGIAQLVAYGSLLQAGALNANVLVVQEAFQRLVAINLELPERLRISLVEKLRVAERFLNSLPQGSSSTQATHAYIAELIGELSTP